MSSMRENNPSKRMSSYSFALIPPSSQIIIGPNLSSVKHAHTITFTCALLNVFLTYFRFSLSPGGWTTHWRHGLTPTQILDSSDQMTRFHSFKLQLTCFNAQCNLASTFSGRKPGSFAAM